MAMTECEAEYKWRGEPPNPSFHEGRTLCLTDCVCVARQVTFHAYLCMDDLITHAPPPEMEPMAQSP